MPVPSRSPIWGPVLDKALLPLIGSVTVNIGVLEQEMDYLIWSLLAGRDVLRSRSTEEARLDLRGQKIGQAITTVVSYGRKADLVGALLAQRFGEQSKLRATVAELIVTLHRIEERRNEIIHGDQAISVGMACREEQPPCNAARK